MEHASHKQVFVTLDIPAASPDPLQIVNQALQTERFAQAATRKEAALYIRELARLRPRLNQHAHEIDRLLAIRADIVLQEQNHD
jgi:hypothetical protein